MPITKRVGKKEAVDPSLELERLHTTGFTLCVYGLTPLICNRMPTSAMQSLLYPSPRKNNAERATTLKHKPIEEYRESVYRARGDDGPTRIVMPTVAFKRAMSDAAKDIPGLAKSEVGRLLWVEERSTDIYGVPQLLMSMVRSAGMQKTPDVRTRAIIEEWACTIRVRFVVGQLREPIVYNLAKAAGMIRGVGDWRVEKGSGTYGQFDLVLPDDPRFLARCKMGRVQQDAALENPLPYDDDTADLLRWYTAEVVRRRGVSVKAPAVESADGVMQ